MMAGPFTGTMSIDEAGQHLKASMARVWECSCCKRQQSFRTIYDNNMRCVCGQTSMSDMIYPIARLPFDGPLIHAAVREVTP